MPQNEVKKNRRVNASGRPASAGGTGAGDFGCRGGEYGSAVSGFEKEISADPSPSFEAQGGKDPGGYGCGRGGVSSVLSGAVGCFCDSGVDFFGLGGLCGRSCLSGAVDRV